MTIPTHVVSGTASVRGVPLTGCAVGLPPALFAASRFIGAQEGVTMKEETIGAQAQTEMASQAIVGLLAVAQPLGAFASAWLILRLVLPSSPALLSSP